MDSRIQDALNDVLLKRDHDSVDDFEHLGHDGSPDERPEQQPPAPRLIDAPRVDDLLHIGDSFQDSVLPSALLDAEAKPVPATPPPSADLDKCAAMAQSSDPFQQPLDPVDPKLASMTFVETERAYRYQLDDDDDDGDDGNGDGDGDDDNEERGVHLQPPLLPMSASAVPADTDLLSKAFADSKVRPLEEDPSAMLFTDYGKRHGRDDTPPRGADVDEDFMRNIRSSMAPEKSPLIDFLGDEASRVDKVRNVADDDSWNVVERADLKREQARPFEPPTKPLPPLPREARQDVYEETAKPPPPLPPLQQIGSKHESALNKRRETSKPKEADPVPSRPLGRKKQEIEIAPKEIFRDMGLGECDVTFPFHFLSTTNRRRLRESFSNVTIARRQ